jgi:hypothetical protein
MPPIPHPRRMFVGQPAHAREGVIRIIVQTSGEADRLPP